MIILENNDAVRSYVRLPGTGTDKRAIPTSCDLGLGSSLAATIQIPYRLEVINRMSQAKNFRSPDPAEDKRRVECASNKRPREDDQGPVKLVESGQPDQKSGKAEDKRSTEGTSNKRPREDTQGPVNSSTVFKLILPPGLVPVYDPASKSNLYLQQTPKLISVPTSQSNLNLGQKFMLAFVPVSAGPNTAAQRSPQQPVQKEGQLVQQEMISPNLVWKLVQAYKDLKSENTNLRQQLTMARPESVRGLEESRHLLMQSQV